MNKLILSTICASSLLVGCAAIDTPLDEDYQFGDTYGSVHTLQAQYCEESDPAQRALYRGLLKRLYSEYPSEGACTDILDLLNTNDETNTKG